MSITLIIGGARSGKSSYAEQLCKESNKKVCYIATAKAIDSDMEDRIKKHQASRPSAWSTIEQYKDFDMLINNDKFIKSDMFLLDCITIMITNIMFDYDNDYDNCSSEVLDDIEGKVRKEIMKLLNLINESNKDIVIVTNEVGMGLVPAYRLGNIFRDIAGRMNQLIAKHADEVYNVICGLPQKLK